MRAIAFASCMLAAAAPAGAGSATTAAAIERTTWRLASLPGHDAAFLAAVPDGVTVRFEGGALQAFAGCNRLRGGYTVAGDRLTLGPIAGTMMACPPPVGDVEDAFVRALTGTLRFAVAGDTLTLTSDAGAALVFTKVPPPVLNFLNDSCNSGCRVRSRNSIVFGQTPIAVDELPTQATRSPLLSCSIKVCSSCQLPEALSQWRRVRP